MPIEGLAAQPEGTSNPGAHGRAAHTTTSDGTQNTGAAESNANDHATAGTHTATALTEPEGTESQQGESTTPEKEKFFTQRDVDRIVQNRVNSGIKAALRKLTGDETGGVTLESLQEQLQQERNARQALETKQIVRAYLVDPVQKLEIKPETLPVIEELLQARLELDDKGQVVNLPEAVDAVKRLAPSLFATPKAPIDAGPGRRTAAGVPDMNSFIRRLAANK